MLKKDDDSQGPEVEKQIAIEAARVLLEKYPWTAEEELEYLSGNWLREEQVQFGVSDLPENAESDDTLVILRVPDTAFERMLSGDNIAEVWSLWGPDEGGGGEGDAVEYWFTTGDGVRTVTTARTFRNLDRLMWPSRLKTVLTALGEDTNRKPLFLNNIESSKFDEVSVNMGLRKVDELATRIAILHDPLAKDTADLIKLFPN